ncbi:RraA family protein [Bacillus sp. JJ1532]|uniref:RraA family protein n=1 Tax=Bacillus sp. JJ1532 TaxID=3122958 RepID=UPI002FFF6F28
MRLCGPALTLKGHAGDNLMLLKALDMAKAGDVIIADMGQLTEAGPWGEVTTVQAKARKFGGFVTNGSVRDSQAIRELGFPVFCKSVSIKGTAKDSLGYINHPISIGDTPVNPGDIILGDDDGIVVIPLQETIEVLIKAKEREAKEAEYMRRIRNVESFFYFMGYDKILQEKGCIIEESNPKEENAL